MAKYRSTITGAVREFPDGGRVPAYPWEPAEAASGQVAISSMTKAEIVAELEALGEDTEGNKDELSARLRAAREAVA